MVKRSRAARRTITGVPPTRPNRTTSPEARTAKGSPVPDNSPSSTHTRLLELIRRTTSSLPEDVEQALRAGREAEEPGSNAHAAVTTILENIELARRRERPLCQDTGTLTFRIHAPARFQRRRFEEELRAAVMQATEQGLLRQNCVDALTGRNTETNLGRAHPVLHWIETDDPEVRVTLIMKGGGCENVGAQYSLPDGRLDAGRDLDGVRRCILDAVHQAQGRGCAPAVLGVCIGGDRSTGYAVSKEQFARRIGQRHAIPQIARLEKQLLNEANSLGIGPMGFGGRTTLLDVFIGLADRLPASYFVTVSYMCWAFRRGEARWTLC